jgi:hypothetical protein
MQFAVKLLTSRIRVTYKNMWSSSCRVIVNHVPSTEKYKILL